MRRKRGRKQKTEEFPCVQISFSRANAYFATVQSSRYNTPPPPPSPSPPPPPPPVSVVLLATHKRVGWGVFGSVALVEHGEYPKAVCNTTRNQSTT